MKTLRDREEFEIGSGRVSLAAAVGIFTLISALFNLIAVFSGRTSPAGFVRGNYLFTLFLTVVILATESINTFLNPVEASALAHQPVHERTYFAAKLMYLCIVAAGVILPINVVPALAGLHLPGVRWFYPALYLTSAYLWGIFIAVTICGILGLMLHFVPVARVRSIVIWLNIVLFSSFA
ncbi:MAG TPA: hypothetical protein VKY31_00955, partial [Terriglobia bacterium]|nr:hypothetical protein [Terriglobia bacterium]